MYFDAKLLNCINELFKFRLFSQIILILNGKRKREKEREERERKEPLKRENKYRKSLVTAIHHHEFPTQIHLNPLFLL